MCRGGRRRVAVQGAEVTRLSGAEAAEGCAAGRRPGAGVVAAPCLAFETAARSREGGMTLSSGDSVPESQQRARPPSGSVPPALHI